MLARASWHGLLSSQARAQVPQIGRPRWAISILIIIITVIVVIIIIIVITIIKMIIIIVIIP